MLSRCCPGSFDDLAGQTVNYSVSSPQHNGWRSLITTRDVLPGPRSEKHLLFSCPTLPSGQAGHRAGWFSQAAVQGSMSG